MDVIIVMFIIKNEKSRSAEKVVVEKLSIVIIIIIITFVPSHRNDHVSCVSGEEQEDGDIMVLWTASVDGGGASPRVKDELE